MTAPPFGQKDLESKHHHLIFILFVLSSCSCNFCYFKMGIISTRFGLVLNAIRDNEDKAEAMGIQTMRYKIIGWMVSAFFVD